MSWETRWSHTPHVAPTRDEAGLIADELGAIRGRVTLRLAADADLDRLLYAVEAGTWEVLVGGEVRRRVVSPAVRAEARALAVRAVADRGGCYASCARRIAWRSDGVKLWAELPI